MTDVDLALAVSEGRTVVVSSLHPHRRLSPSQSEVVSAAIRKPYHALTGTQHPRLAPPPPPLTLPSSHPRFATRNVEKCSSSNRAFYAGDLSVVPVMAAALQAPKKRVAAKKKRDRFIKKQIQRNADKRKKKRSARQAGFYSMSTWEMNSPAALSAGDRTGGSDRK